MPTQPLKTLKNYFCIYISFPILPPHFWCSCATSTWSEYTILSPFLLYSLFNSHLELILQATMFNVHYLFLCQCLPSYLNCLNGCPLTDSSEKGTILPEFIHFNNSLWTLCKNVSFARCKICASHFHFLSSYYSIFFWYKSLVWKNLIAI